jgi:colanic acid/amylovoran biosynthesis glycosyltransferase
MKIAFVVSEFPILSETFILNQITGLINLGHGVTIFSRYNPHVSLKHPEYYQFNLTERIHYLTIPESKIKRLFHALYVIFAHFILYPRQIINALNIFKYGKDAFSLRLLLWISPFLSPAYDVILCHYGSNGEFVASLKELGIPGKLVTMFHGYDLILGQTQGGKIYQKLFKQCDCLLSISNYTRENLISFGANSEKIVCHPVGINLELFHHFHRDATKKDSEPVIILTVGRLIEDKGYLYGISAIHTLLTRNPSLRVEYRILGNGSLRDELEKAVEEFTLGNTITFLGAGTQSDVYHELSKADIFLLPSIHEILPVVIMEAHAVGLPIIATNIGGIPEEVLDGTTGFLVPPHDSDAIAEKLLYLIEHPDRRITMGNAGRKHIEDHYDIKKLNTRLVEIFKQL